MQRLHTDRDYERQLRTLREHLLRMAGRVEEMIADAIRAVIDRDVARAERTIAEDHKVAVLSVIEGEDKPLKYPNMFHAADLMIINKIDLLPYLRFDLEKCKACAREVNPDICILELSCHSGEGIDAWYAWLRDGVAAARHAKE